MVKVAERNEEEQAEILARLRRVEGQIRGIQRMIEEARDCESIVTQLLAARAALDKASLLVLSHHLERCLTTPAGQQSRVQLERVIQFFLKFSTVAPETQVPGEDQADTSA